MRIYKLAVASALLGTAATGLAFELPILHRHARTRPDYFSGIPKEKYQFRPQSITATSVSKTDVLLPSDKLGELKSFVKPSENQAELEKLVLAKLKQLRPEEFLAPANENDLFAKLKTQTVIKPFAPETLRNKEVRLYQLSDRDITIEHCSISQIALRIREDGIWSLSLKADQNPKPATGEPVPYNPRLHIKRNEFVVKLRCLGAAKVESAAGNLAAGRPVLFELVPNPFWVENGQPRWVVEGGQVQGHIPVPLSQIDRVEIEFYYH